MPFIKGTELHREDQAHVLRAYVHRYTGDHKPLWNNQLRPDGTAYPVQFANDQDWLANTTFAVRTDGRLDQRFKRCMSSPTWPNQ